MREGRPNFDEYEALHPGWRAQADERAERIKTLIKFLRVDNYYVGLCDFHQYDTTYWGILNRESLIVETSLFDPKHSMFFEYNRSSAPALFDEYRALYLDLWNDSDTLKNKDRIIGWLKWLCDTELGISIEDGL